MPQTLPSHDQLLFLARCYIKEEVIPDIEIDLEDGEDLKVRIMILAATDRLFRDGKISESESSKACAMLGFTPEERARLRSKAKAFMESVPTS
jgi:hypothetical protein